MIVSYLTVNGQIISETRDGVESDYISDPSGSTIALTDASGNITDTFEYWPFGELISHIGSNPTFFCYKGTLGYHTDSARGNIYVRARVLDPILTRWTTVDPLWPGERTYVYASSSPISNSDPTGLGSCAQDSSSRRNTLRHGKCDLPYDQWACSRLCKAQGYGTGTVTYTYPGGYTEGTDGIGYNFGTDPDNSCNCTCSGGPLPSDCSPGQIGFCMRACKAIGRTYVGCVPITVGKNDARNCRCSEK
jgi:RHS repeat-associated protein